MTQQLENYGMPPALCVKLKRFADGLTQEERAQVRVAQTESGPGELLPSLHAKLQQSAEGLTPEDQAQLRLLMEHVYAGRAAIDGAEVEGYIAPGHDKPVGLSNPINHPGSQGYQAAFGAGTGLPWYGGTAITGLVLFGAFFLVAP